MSGSVSRRDVLKVFVAVPVVGTLVSACGKKDKPDSCSDVSALSDADKAARQTLQYTDSSPQPDKRCSGCSLYQAAADAAQCGSCQVVKGPIHPDGYCVSWSKKA